ncbi:MAG: U32 family peptidase [Eubacteriales bacterium]|nr:U32 family peptidase [Eubacteriales bacterium]
MRKMELLAPAGSFEALKAAINAGADAVYFAGSDFGARKFASNFDDEEIVKAIMYCKTHGVKSYITVNTLISDREFKKLCPFLELIYTAGADGVIIQDLGVAKLIREQLPDLPLHASTQMTVCTPDGAKQLEELGFKQVVLSRELTKDQIEEICKSTNIKAEIFVHGALCVSYSGQCLMSSMIGGRSGNRGCCAQPCRMNYTLDGKKGAFLSLKDLSLINHIETLSQIGVDSLKIEGRMKGPEYISVVTSIYRKAIDGKTVTKDDIKLLENIFYRGGYTNGYFTNNKTEDMYAPFKDENPYLRQTKHKMPPEKEATIKYVGRDKAKLTLPSFKEKNRKGMSLSVRVRSQEQLKAVLETPYSTLYIPAGLICKFASSLDLSKVVCTLPRLDMDKELIKTVRDLCVEKAMASNIGQIAPLNEMGFKVIGDFTLNIYNSLALKHYKEIGLWATCLSQELMLPQIRDIAKCMPVYCLAYGRLPLMYIENPPKGKSLTDRQGTTFAIDGHEIFNSVPLYMADKTQDMTEVGIREGIIMLTIEDREQTRTIINAFAEKASPKGNFTRGKYYKN